jgi:hypothetical protein
MGSFTNIGGRGTYCFTSVVYAAPSLDCSATQGLEPYHVYLTPTEGFTTRTIDISANVNLEADCPWPFDKTQVPINGHIRIPHGDGPFPLVIAAYGNGAEHSTSSYLHLCELLASHGIIAAMIDLDFLNGFNWAENDERSRLHSEHLKQFQIWNALDGHPLAGKIDLSMVVIIPDD